MHPLRRFIRKEKLTTLGFIDKYQIGLSRSFVVMVCCGTANLAKGTAERISQATGIPPEVLMFPELDKKYARWKKVQPTTTPPKRGLSECKKEQEKTKDATVCKCLQNQ